MSFLNSLTEFRELAVRALNAKRTALRQVGIKLLFVLLFLIAGFTLFSHRQYLLHGVTAQDGQIIVNSPTVYTRQRLVNDRLSQTAWLQEQLLVTRGLDPTFRSIDQVRVHKSSRDTNIGVTVGANGTTLNVVPAPKPGTPPPSPPPDGSAVPPSESNEPAIPLVDPTTSDLFRAKNTYREEVRAEMMETQLDDRHDIRGNTIYRLAFDATILAGTKTDPLAIIKVKLSHDWKNDRFKADYDELYAEWLRHMQKVLDVSTAGVADSLYNRAFARDVRLQLTLPRFLLRSTCYLLMERKLVAPSTPPGTPRKNIRYNVNNHPCNAESGSDENTKARDFLEQYIKAYMTQRQKIIEAVAWSNIKKVADKREETDEKLIAPNFKMLESLRDGCLANVQSGKKSLDELNQLTATLEYPSGRRFDVRCPDYDIPSEALLGGAMLFERISDPNLTKGLSESELTKKLQALLSDVTKDCSEPYSLCALPQPTRAGLTCFAASYIKASVNSLWDRPLHNWEYLGYFMDVNIIGRESNNCKLFVSRRSGAADTSAASEECEMQYMSDPAGRLRCRLNARRSMAAKDECEVQYVLDPAGRLKCRLNDGAEVYSYSITPKNLVQRLSTASDTKNAIHAALNTRLDVQGRDLQSVVQSLQQESDKARAIETSPIVVGFGFASGSRPVTKSNRDTDTIKSTEFGWLIAPRIRVEGKREQIDGQYALAAVISVPSWWKSVRLGIVRCWVPRRALHTSDHFEQCSERMLETHDVVRLPGDIRGLSEKLRFDVVQEPYLSTFVSSTLQIGQPAELILTGGRLWRSTEVTLGAQRADEIVVLPNMEGIVAKFKCVNPQMPLRMDGISVDIRVWTSEGVTDPIAATLVMPEQLRDVMKRREESAVQRGDIRRPVVCPDNSPYIRDHSSAGNPDSAKNAGK